CAGRANGAIWIVRLAQDDGQKKPAVSPPVSPPAPFDALESLRTDRIPPEVLAAVGDGDPARAPSGLVAVLGEAGPVHRGEVHNVAYSANGRWLASASFDKTLILWEVATGRARRVLRGHDGEVSAVAFSKDGKTLVSASYDGTLRFWPTEGDATPQTV